MAGRRRQKKDSSVKTLFMAFAAILVMILALSVVAAVYRKIRKDYENLENQVTEESTSEEIVIDSKMVTGWNLTDQGYVYLQGDGNLLKDQWKEIDGFLYHFGADGIMTTGQWTEEGQIYTFSEKGYLKNIETDLDYKPEGIGENLNSLVKSNAVWCYLGEEEGLFKPICYRKTVENKVRTIGGEVMPERTTANSMRIYGDYLYYLPMVKDSQKASLTQNEAALCNRLFRIIPGDDEKELIADDVDGYLVLDQTIYYAKGGSICSTSSGTAYKIGENQFSVVIRDGKSYLMDGAGQPVSGVETASYQVGDRIYELEGQDGEIVSVVHGNETIGSYTFSLEASSGVTAIYRTEGTEKKRILQADMGIQSYCIADQQIYYCAYTKKDNDLWYSRIFKASLDGNGKTEVSENFLGTMKNMYYYESAGEMYGEYSLQPWNSSQGKIAAIRSDGTIYTIIDDSVRPKDTTSGSSRLELVTVQDGTMICIWKDSISDVWDKAIQMSAGARMLLEMNSDVEIETEPETTEEVIVKPIESSTGESSGSAELEGPGSEAPTLPASTENPDADKPTMPATTATDEVIIKPLS